jgi:dephospho-CoA kinase
MIVLGLTGSIGMGKSTTSAMFRELGVPVHDADETVHRLYGGVAAPLIERRFPGTVVAGVVDRGRLAAAVLDDPDALRSLESIIHPLVQAEEQAFLKRQGEEGRPLVVLDIPLLFEVGAEDRVDRIAVASAPADVQRRRVLARPGMTEAKLDAILRKQIPDAEKRARADFIIETGDGMEPARRAVAAIVARLVDSAG